MTAPDMQTSAKILEEIVAAYIQETDSGGVPDRQALLDRHPELADELRAFFADHDRMNAAARGLRPASPAPGVDPGTAETIGPAAVTGDPGRKAPLGPGQGRRVGDYEIIDEIARGGMGVVYRARHVSLNRVVALKFLLLGPLAAAAEVQRFRHEAEAAAHLDHPNIVPIYEVGAENIEGVAAGVPFFSMKLIEGGSLAQWIADCRLNIADYHKQSSKLLAQVARAVHHAHQRGILHRDLKPANILLHHSEPSEKPAIANLRSAVPMVTDFGLAKRVAADAGTTDTGSIVGTPAYMAPEQAQADRTLTTRADVYSLGAILYELLTGRPPFQADNPLDIILQVKDKEPDRPRTVEPRVHRDLETICLKCLEKDPQKRYDSAEELARDLERWLAGEPIVARPASAWERTAKWARRRPALAALTGGGTLAIAVLLTLSAFLWHNAELRAETVQDLDKARSDLKVIHDENGKAQLQLGKLEDQAKAKRDEVEALKRLAAAEGARAVAAQETARNVRYDADIQLADAAWGNDNLPLLFGLLDRTRPASGTRDLRGFEWNYLWRLCHHERWALHLGSRKPVPTGTAVALPLLAFSPDGKLLALTDQTAPIKLVDTATGRVIRTLAAPVGTPSSLAFAGAGKLQVIVTQSALGKFNMPDFKAQDSLANFENAFLEQHIPIDGGKAAPPQKFAADHLLAPLSAFVAGEKGMGMAVAAMGLKVKGFLVTPFALALAPDRRTLAMGGVLTPFPFNPAQQAQQGGIVLWDLQGKREPIILRGHKSMVSYLAFARDGKLLASSALDATIRIWDVGNPGQAPTERAVLNDSSPMILALAFTPDGKTLISGSVSGMIKLWDVTSARLRTSLKGHADGILSMALAADGKELVSGSVDGTVKLWNLAAHQGPTVVKGPARTTQLLTFSPDGQQVIAVDANGQLLRADARTGEPAAPLNVKGNLFAIHAADLAADGKWLVTAGMGKGVDKGVDIWDIQAGKLETSFGIRGQVWAVSISPDRGKLAVGTDRVQILELPSGKVLHALTPFKEKFMRRGNTFANRVTATAFSPDGKLLAASGKDGTAALFDVQSGKERAVFTLPSEVAGVAFTPDGKRLAVAAGQTVTIYDVESKKEVLVLEGYSHQPAQMSFSPYGRRLATCGGLGELQHGTGVKLWDLATGQEVLTLARSKIAIRVAFSPNGDRLAAAFSQNAASMFMASTSGETWIWDGTAAKNEP